MVLVLCALILMAVDYRNPAALGTVRTASTMLLYPLLVTVDFPQRFYQQTTGFFSKNTTLLAENTQLKQQVKIYAAQQQNMNLVYEENERLRHLLSAAQQTRYTYSMAEILKVADDPDSGLVTLNKGTRDGIYEGQVVLIGKQIYGQITAVTPVSATVMQLIDREHSIPVQNQRTGERALANGYGRGMPLEIRNLSATSTVEEGDVFLSSGLGELFPAGFEVAQVLPDGIEFKQGDPFATVWAMPLVDYESVREVLLVWEEKSEEIEDYGVSNAQ